MKLKHEINNKKLLNEINDSKFEFTSFEQGIKNTLVWYKYFLKVITNKDNTSLDHPIPTIGKINIENK